MSLPLQVRSYLTPLYAQALSSIYHFYDQTRDPSYALAQDVDIYEIMMRDPKIFQGVQERLLSVSGPNWRVFAFNNSKDPADIALAKLVDDALRFIPHFVDSRQRLATAIFRGQACELMTGKRKLIRLGQDKVARHWWMFNEPKNIDPRRFTYRNIHEEKEDGTKHIRTELWMSTVPMWQGNTPVKNTDYVKGDMPTSLMSYGYRKVEHPEWLMRVVYNDEEARLGYGRGLVDCLYFYHWIKQILLREGLQGVERWSQGIVVGTLDPDAPGTPDTQTNAAMQTAMLDALSKMRSRHVYVQGKHDDIEVIQGGGEGHQMVMSFIEYVDDCIMAVCTGAVLMSSKSAAGDAGSHARDETGTKTQNKVIIADQMKIDEDQSAQMVGMWVRQNWKLLGQIIVKDPENPLVRRTLQEARMPQIKTIPPKEINPTEAATRYSTIWQANPQIKFRKDDFYEALGETPVNEEEDEFVQGADPAAVASAAGNPGNDPSQMMMEGNGGGNSKPSPQGVAMRARAMMSSEAIELLVAKKVEEIVTAKMVAAPYAEPQPIVFNAGATTVNVPKQDPANVNVVVEPPASQPITLNVEAPKLDERQHAETMAAHDRSAVASMAVAEKLDALVRKETPAPVVNVEQPVVNVAAPIVRLEAAQAPEVHVDVAAPIVKMTVPQAPQPIINFDASKGDRALGRIADLMERALDWFKSKKTKKTVEFDKDKDGNITGAKVESK